jgi:hypothetical protein
LDSEGVKYLIATPPKPPTLCSDAKEEAKGYTQRGGKGMIKHR